MSSDEEEEANLNFDDYSDITPVPDNPLDTVAKIAHSPDYSLAYSLFLAIKEYTPRALLLTSFLLENNPANYSIWLFRQEILKVLLFDSFELIWTTKLAFKHPKCYQIWNHRVFVTNILCSPVLEEISFVNQMLILDSKNYHAWGYRQMVIRNNDLFALELEDVERFLDQDVYNNSAWNQRFFCIRNLSIDLSNELQYCLSKLRVASRNESCWSYIRGVADLKGVELKDLTEIVQYIQGLSVVNVPALSFLLDVYESTEGDESRVNANEVCLKLIENDFVRRRYWEWRKQKLQVFSS